MKVLFRGWIYPFDMYEDGVTKRPADAWFHDEFGEALCCVKPAAGLFPEVVAKAVAEPCKIEFLVSKRRFKGCTSGICTMSVSVELSDLLAGAGFSMGDKVYWSVRLAC